ncbi:MarR family winged helix-turn-helix transcriptional regulator [Planococcus sp. N028]|uniref:MarR family winged helix-turn-helix transcriptional regulator n=1 Tax=Planococcus shixiaomingii TaxID=3058393 RepID=A0ABT8MX82_9BACL|nr:MULTISPECIES: MarR family winged helix-turn-helix transcriptional regulator [unclassified Planococcus (in: firmicutes)]MDN7240240.1 MarR family winged helix-turn-helix transcriptional regulator [Planococcus sp. N028]WKA56143.1 MarR family winged helix-turn-helix transcriptional regulator [Planococcus sp. N022]
METKRDTFQTMMKRFGLLNKNSCMVGGLEITLVQSHILYEIDKREEPSMQEVAETLGIDISTFSRQIQTLIKMKLVRKTPSSQDKRIYLLSLTTEGKFVAATVEESMEQHLDEIFSHMSEFEQETVLHSMKVLNEAMAKSTVCCKPIYK